MLFIPLPLLIAEIVIFFYAVNSWGFFNTLGIYLLPCLLGFLIVTTLGRVALLTLQSSLTKGQLPASRLLHTGAIFISGLLFMVPSFFARALAIVLFLPGLRHLVVWRFKLFMAQKLMRGASAFNFGRPFGFGSSDRPGTSGFRFYSFSSDGRSSSGFDSPQEREVREANVLDVIPLKVTHEVKKDES